MRAASDSGTPRGGASKASQLRAQVSNRRLNGRPWKDDRHGHTLAPAVSLWLTP